MEIGAATTQTISATDSSGKKLAKEANTVLLGQIPIVQGIREGGDAGLPAVLGKEVVAKEAFDQVAKNVLRQIAIRNEQLEATKIVNVSK